MRTHELLGKTFNRITVIKEVYRDSKTVKLECVCSCGKVWNVSQSDIITGNTKSCGCYSRELTATRNTKHGMAGSRPYNIWSAIRMRCTNPKYPEFHYYGGRGITRCDRWKKFELFWEDMKEGYSDKLQIDRIDNNGNYCKENCRWVTPHENSMNRRNTINR